LGNKNIKQHDILYRCYQFTHKSDADEITNLRERLKQKTTEKKEKDSWDEKPAKNGTFLHLCVTKPRWEPMRVVKKTKIKKIISAAMYLV
jgi:hypothetical protein